MNKKGFTLVELLAVIAILAILVIIALPNIMGMFNDARKSSFSTEVKQIYKVAQQQWVSDSLFATSEKVYTRCESCTGKSLDLSGRTQLEYYIKINKAGSVIEYYATDGTYQYAFNDSAGLNIQDISDPQVVAELQPNQILQIVSDNAEIGEVTYLYTTESGFYLGQSAEVDLDNHIYDNYQDAMSNNPMGTNEPAFVKGKLSGGVITEMELGFMYNGSIHYFKGGSPNYYQGNVNALKSLVSAESCQESYYPFIDENNNEIQQPYIRCEIPASGSYSAFKVEAVSDGSIHTYTYGTGFICQVGNFANGWASNCTWD